MPGQRKQPRRKNPTAAFLNDSLDDDRGSTSERFGRRSKHAEQNKIDRTTALRAANVPIAADLAALPTGEVTQVHSLFITVEHEGRDYRCSRRKTMQRSSGMQIVVGDRVQFRPGPEGSDAVIEQTLPRQTILTRADSFNSVRQQPIVANADQMLIVASLRLPRVKWGLVDRMIVAAQAGGLAAIVCLNKMDAAEDEADRDNALAALAHYRSMGLRAMPTSVVESVGITELRGQLIGQTTVLAGHSGVGKSSLISAVQPGLDLRVGVVSVQTDKGRHTTTSARRYPLGGGGFVIDTPGVKHFGLWNVTRENLAAFFPDVAAGTAPQWRVESMQRIEASLPAGG